MMKLNGKLAWIHFGKSRGKSCGFHQVKIEKVIRMGKKITAIVARAYSAESQRFDGRKFRILPNEWQQPYCGYVFRGSIRPILEGDNYAK